MSGDVVSDFYFDEILSPRARKLAGRHWTPVCVAIRAAQLLTGGRPVRVLDVGAGAGKLCLVGALTSSAEFVGVEQRPWLVREASALVRLLKVPRVRFLAGNFQEVDWSGFDAFYFFNPFHENLDDSSPIDANVSLGEEKFLKYTAQALERLRPLKEGTRVVTYHGSGVDLRSAHFRLARREKIGSDALCLWVKELH